MSTPPGWEPRPGPTRGDSAGRSPRGSSGWASGEADPRRQQGGRGAGPGPSFTPGSRDNGQGGPRPTRVGQGRRPPQNANGYAKRGPSPGGSIYFDAMRSGGITNWIGRMPTWSAVLLLAAGGLFGIIVTVIAGQEPGGLLGFFIIVAAVTATLGIRRGKVYLLFPAPALTFFVSAIVAGKIHDAKLGSSVAGLGAGSTQWFAGIFFPAVVATILVVLIGGSRWLLGRQLVTGQLSTGRPAPGEPRPQPRDRRPGSESWSDDNAPAPRQAGPTNSRPPRPPRDSWGDPRPNTTSQNQAQGQGRPPRPSPSYNPKQNPTPQRPPRHQPPESWT